MSPTETNAVANEFLRLAEKEKEEITNIKLIKMMYVAQGLSLSLCEEELFEEPIQAWQYGPVIPSIYHEFKHFAAKPITKKSIVFDDESEEKKIEPKLTNQQSKKIVELTWKLYKNISALRLVELTHDRGTPWSIVYKHGYNEIIPNSLIKKYYDKFIVNLEKRLEKIKKTS